MSEGLGRSGGRGANRGTCRSGGKHPIYEDLDTPQSTDWLTLSDSGTSSGLGDPSSSQKKSKRADTNENVVGKSIITNPGYFSSGRCGNTDSNFLL
jgi:hypothetical protein